MAVAPAAEALSVGTPPAAESLVPLATGPAVEPSAAPSVVPAVLKAAQVEWEVALVRDSPKTGKVIARLPRGSQVRVGPVKDGWYPVTYGSGYSSEGWVYRGAIGR
jgi:SH3-like domain-containing protein